MKNRGLANAYHASAALFLIASTLLLPVPGVAQTRAAPAAELPSLGDGNSMGTSAERRLGERIAREIYRDPDYIDDAVLVEYVQSIWQPLLAAARQRGELTDELDQRFAWEVLMGADRTINAFAVPGGYLGLHLGLIGVVTSDDELASVLGHELSHVTQRHIARMMDSQNRQTPWMIGAMVLGALAASKNPDAANAMIVGGQAAAVQNQLNFSRDMEREADRIGYGVMTQAGFDPLGFVSMFEKLQQASRISDNGSFPYLRSHPLTTERIADMQSRQALDARPTPTPQSPVQAMMAARARVLGNPGVDMLRAWVGEAKGAKPTGPAMDVRSVGVLYAGTLSALRQRDFAQARGLVVRLQALVEPHAAAVRIARLLAAEIEWTAGDLPATAALVDMQAPGRPELLLGSQIRTRSGKAVDAIARLQPWVALHPRDGTAWQLLAAAYTAQGQTLRAIRAEAEAQVARLDYAGAMDRFRAAQDWARKPPVGSGPVDDIEASIIDTRARQIQAQLKQQALDKLDK
ncbi:Putative Zn-dependent protease, contains TPR repeats [Rhodoferax sp. OV413]|uniref:M48 family metalloprotease n=1 Tax=Rhodoferax sp. OV413 TaxID=1855285 RepID=UPI00088CA930|nr:Putative Zn-dependent protease, contains TPR repeats [Rhodoferax sp. OV413]